MNWAAPDARVRATQLMKQMLVEYLAAYLRGGTAEMARKLMDIGFLISFAGNVTFKKAENLRDAARVVPLDKLLIETDCPFLAPVPNRGKRNEPAFVVHTAQFLAGFYGIELEKLAERTTGNFLDFFRLEV